MSSFGTNLGFVDELYARYQQDPASVSESWQEFFADYRPQGGDNNDDAHTLANTAPTAHPQRARARDLDEAPEPAPEAHANGTAQPVKGDAPAASQAIKGQLEPLRGIAGKIAENMAVSLTVPTATSVRNVAVKLLEENRRVINQHQVNVYGPKVSFTHLIAWAVVRALVKHPSMNGGFAEVDGAPHRVVRPEINLGLAIDMEKRGERVLLVPGMKDAGSLDFSTFIANYGDIVKRARQNKLRVEDFQDITVTLTNPGMLGTNMSVPRLMNGQGTIIGVGAVGYPAEYTGMSADVITELGLSKVMTLTSTYDHRVIQGAESGAFLATVEQLLLGKDGFYETLYADLGVPNETVQWADDKNVSLNPGAHEGAYKQAAVLQLIRAFRSRGHLWADLDPLGVTPREPNPELELSFYNLTVWDLDRRFVSQGLAGATGQVPLREILDTLRETYCRHIGVEYMHIAVSKERLWLQQRMEKTRNNTPLSKELQLRILAKLNAAEALERFLHTTYTGQKRFSLEGAETTIPMLDVLLSDGAQSGITEAVIGMAHRGRLNVLANTIGKNYGMIFGEFEGNVDPKSAHGSGDVKYHLGFEGTHVAPNGQQVKLVMSSNPSHLEAVNPVVEGMTRARQDLIGDHDRAHVLPILLHGDAAFAGQGVVAETLNLSELKGYRTGGTIHIVVNNQIGFTTGPADARSSHYATDVAKMTRSPIFHVNGDHPEDCVRVIQLALAFRQEFKRDVVIDLICYRRWGHNETDDPSYTQPVLYAKIDKQRSVRKLYTESLLRRGDIDMETAERALDDFRAQLEHVHNEVRRAKTEVSHEVKPDQEAIEGEAVKTRPETAVEQSVIDTVLDGLERRPDDFETHPKLAKQLAKRRERVETGKIDWALAETLSFGSIVMEGTPVRLSGEDSGRGTFSQRHAILYDHRTGVPHIPLAHLTRDQAQFAVYDSLLSEFAVLGFDYGYSVMHPKALVLWEAQFGDFVNGAQVIIDQFISSAEDKWGQRNSLVMLLPHGYEGQGPEHSSARIERFLQLSARGNMQVCYPSSPAQYFHLLRRQARLEPRKPLVVFTPKSGLRLPAAVSRVEELVQGQFNEVIDDASVADANKIKRIVLCTGKVYYDIDAYRVENNLDTFAVVRVEQLYPFPGEQLAALFKKYKHADEVVWAQEEPRNMGAWDFLDERVKAKLGKRQTLTYVGRAHSPSPATGSQKRHIAEQEALVRRAFADIAPS